jgi:AhpC/TSA antioxidant enzyme
MSFAEPATLELYSRASPYPFEFYGDHEREAYAAFGFGRGSIARVWLDPRVWMASARGVSRGHVSGLPSEDTLQLGGDVLVDAEGTVTWVYPSDGPDDRPSVQEIAAARSGNSNGAG